MKFAERLKELRKENQCTQKQLADYLGLTANCVCEWENKRSEPSLSSIYKIAEFFGVSSDFLLGLENDYGAKISDPIWESYTIEERQLIIDFRQLNYYKQELIKNNIKAMLPTEAERAQNKNGSKK